ncbi:sensor histidine kinase [Paucibacter sp. R3-3]|uniref:histidine kinase n=1 Tax=Roseateles agri TaxID=3098619 RepID=A0ABU5DL06_9BURK|nr:sensor histidine kinase [Paucibacter sp. R3-3]MDY0746829.1 sensor histidine kinase [Paucibacter sp. R3-3]
MATEVKRWLQRELQIKLLLPVLLIVVVGGVLALLNAGTMVEKTYDRWLLDSARALSKQVRFEGDQAVLDLQSQAESMLNFDVLDKIYFSVSQSGRRVSGRAGMPTSGSNERQYRLGGRAFNAEFDGQPVRIAWVALPAPGGGIVDVMVAETLNKRSLANSRLLWWYAAIGGLLVAAAMAIVVVLRGTLRPLEDMASRWSVRAHASLDPMPTNDVPRELLPFAHALNSLLGRVRGLLERERQFAGTAAHQLRTPLAGLQLGLHRASQATDIESARRILQELGPATERMGRMIQQLLALSRLDPEIGAGLDFDQLDLVDLARDVGESFLDAADAKGVQLELVEPAGGAVSVRGHRELLGEALGNLLDNAIKYTPRGGRVLLEVDANPPRLSVADDGPGIAESFQPVMFDRFSRGSAGGAEPTEGSGLGLAIVREIAALHGASVQFERGSLGGACFVIQFGGR